MISCREYRGATPSVVLPSKWVGKEEAAYHLSSDFRAMASFVPAHADARIGPFSNHRRTEMLKRGQASVVLSLDLTHHPFHITIASLAAHR